MNKKTEIGMRLAIRREGNWVNAYLAKSETMEDALIIGSIALVIAEQGDIFLRWKDVMTGAMTIVIKEFCGQEPEMTERAAPEHERSGSA